MTKTVLVTGGAGYIGSHCCKVLASAGYHPVVYDDLSTGHRDLVKWGPLVEGDIRDRSKLADCLATHRPALVMHFAALALVGESVTQPERYWDVNVGGVFALLETMRATGCDKLVFSSSCAVYGEPDAMPIDEQATKSPVNPYGASKLTAEWMMESFDRAHGLKSVRLRYFNACGADPDGEIGEDHSPETHLIPLVLEVAHGQRESISIFGTDYPTPDGTAVRDYIHVLDLAAAHLAAAEHLLGGGKTAAVNLGTGEGVSVADVIGTVERVTGRKVAAVSGPRRAGDPPRLVANPALAESLLGWKARRSGLETAIADAWAWHQSRFDDVQPAIDPEIAHV
jgi:UDP-arabinose 4-epimerase